MLELKYLIVLVVISLLVGLGFADERDSILVIFDAGGSGSGTGWADNGTSVILTTETDSVGIGISTPSEKLEVDGYIKGTGLCIGSDCKTDWGSVTGVGGSGDVNYIAKFTGTGSSIGNSQIFDDGTNVGIGTTSPDKKLHIDGALKVSNIGDPSILLNYDSDGSNGSWTIYANDSDERLSIVNGDANLTLRTSGNIGIKEYNPGATLSISGNMTVGSGYSENTAPTNGMIIQGNTGIGITNPGSRLSVGCMSTASAPASSGSTDPSQVATIYATNIGSGGYGLRVGVSNTTGNSWLQSGKIDNYATNSNLLLNINGGNVGIGTTEPKAKLDVNGDIYSKNERLIRVANRNNWTEVLELHFQGNSLASAIVSIMWAAPSSYSGEVIYRIYGYSTIEPVITDTIITVSGSLVKAEAVPGEPKIRFSLFSPDYASGSNKALIKVVNCGRVGQDPTINWLDY